jgi:hypothetical protein
MRIARYLTAVTLTSALHFALSVLVVPLTLRAGDALAAGAARDLVMGGLVAATRVLYTPLLTLALYPRHWFPGRWVYVPIGINSLLGGLALVSLFYLLRRGRPRPR